MIHNKIHLTSPGCPWPSIALQCRIVAQNTIHFIIFYSVSFASAGYAGERDEGVADVYTGPVGQQEPSAAAPTHP